MKNDQIQLTFINVENVFTPTLPAALKHNHNLINHQQNLRNNFVNLSCRFLVDPTRFQCNTLLGTMLALYYSNFREIRWAASEIFEVIYTELSSPFKCNQTQLKLEMGKYYLGMGTSISQKIQLVPVTVKKNIPKGAISKPTRLRLLQ